MPDGADTQNRWLWRKLFLDRQGNPDEQIVAAGIGQLTLLFLIGWILWHGGTVALVDFATAQGAIWAACGIGKMTTGIGGS